MGVRAKFRCDQVADGQVRLEAVTNGSPENDQFFQYTPSGHISLGIVTPAAIEQFKQGAEYYVDFTPAS